MKMNKNDFAIITGASTGIGRTIAIKLANKGYFVGLVGRNREELNSTMEMIGEIKGKGEIFICDLSQTDSINTLILTITKSFGKVDVLVNVAGIWHGNDKAYAGVNYEKFSQQVIIDTLHVGLLAPMLLVNKLIRFMPKKSKIINISGTFESGAKGWLPYFVSKKGIEDFTIGLAEELKERNIQVNAISPSDVATEAYKKFFPQYIKDAIDPNEIAKFVVSLLSDRSHEITGKVFVLKKDKVPYEGYHT
mgnify:CR=1 FL=1